MLVSWTNIGTCRLAGWNTWRGARTEGVVSGVCWQRREITDKLGKTLALQPAIVTQRQRYKVVVSAFCEASKY